MLVLALGQSATHAAVSGSYQGTITEDSNLGLIGQTMRVDFTYNENTAPELPTGSNYALFQDFLQSMTVTIGSNVWQWGPNGYSSIFLYNDYSPGSGVEDAISSFNGTFIGPSLVGMPVAPEAYSLDMYFTDRPTNGQPDALDSALVLPAAAPNPNLFRVQDFQGVETNENIIQFHFSTGLEEGEGSPNFRTYFIHAADITLAAPVPEPSAALMLLAGMGVLGAAVLARRQRTG